MRALGKLALGLLVAGAVLLGVEAALRGVHGPPEPSVSVFSGLEEVEQYLVETRRGELQPTYQGRPIGGFHREGSGRIAVLGGSSVHGGSIGVGDREEFARLLEKPLGRRMLNLGSPGLDSHDLRKLVAELEGVQLDALIVYTGHNDFGNTYFHQRYGTLGSGLQVRIRSLLERTQLFCQLRARLGPPEAADGELVSGASQLSGEAVPIERLDLAGEYLLLNLRRMAWESHRRGVPFVVVTPVSAVTRAPKGACVEDRPCARDLWTEARETSDPEQARELFRRARDLDTVPIRAPTWVVEEIRGLAAEPGVILVDAESGLPRQEGLDVPSDSLFMDAVHLSTSGHAAMADLLAEELVPVLGRGR